MMFDTAGARELLTLSVNGVVLRSTHHRPASEGSPDADPSGSVAVLFLNSLSSPRSLIGDSAVYWAESLAAQGYHCFRFDLPGLGDSEGDRPNDLLKFTNEGGYADAAVNVVRQLVQSRGLSGVILFGHCAGATTALYAASECKECKGLILMDPYFNLPKALTSSLRPELVNWARGSKVGAIIRALYDRVREIPGSIGKGSLPANANFPLIARCKRAFATGLPVLILKAPQPPVAGGNALQSGAFDYLAFVLGLAARREQLTVKILEETDHSFANRAGRLAVLQSAQFWLRQYFPHTRIEAPSADNPVRHLQEKTTVVLGTAVTAHVLSGRVSGYGDQQC